MTQPFSARSLALFGFASALKLLLDQTAKAHGIAHGGLAARFLHPISGVDHRVLLVGIGAAASCISSQLLLWGLAGAIGDGVFGALGGTLPAQEFLAALEITSVAVLVLRCLRSQQQSPQLGACAALVAAAAAVHAMLHGLDAPADGSAALWWLGAFTGSVLVSSGSFLLLRCLPLAWTRGVALLSLPIRSTGVLGALPNSHQVQQPTKSLNKGLSTEEGINRQNQTICNDCQLKLSNHWKSEKIA